MFSWRIQCICVFCVDINFRCYCVPICVGLDVVLRCELVPAPVCVCMCVLDNVRNCVCVRAPRSHVSTLIRRPYRQCPVHLPGVCVWQCGRVPPPRRGMCWVPSRYGTVSIRLIRVLDRRRGAAFLYSHKVDVAVTHSHPLPHPQWHCQTHYPTHCLCLTQ